MSSRGSATLRDRNPQHWKLLFFYYNPEQPRLLVAKRYGSPITMNYAKPVAWVITAAPIAFMVACAVLERSRILH